jgi:hypothetical protein
VDERSIAVGERLPRGHKPTKALDLVVEALPQDDDESVRHGLAGLAVYHVPSIGSGRGAQSHFIVLRRCTGPANRRQ